MVDSIKRFFLAFFIAVCIFPFVKVGDAYAWLDGYSYRKTITVQADNIDADLTGFPLHISISADTDIGEGMEDTTNYYDIRFTDTSDNVLPYEKERMVISSGSATGDYWVKTNLDDTNGATIYVYYGKSGDADGSNATDVWDSDFKGVWHLGEGDSTDADFYKDSTQNDNDGTLSDSDGDVEQVDGKAGKGLRFYGDNDKINVGNDSSLDLDDTFTLSGWLYVDNFDDTTYGFLISKDEYPNGGSYDLGFANNKPYAAINSNPTGASWGAYRVDDVMALDSWIHIAAVRDADDNLEIFLDGVSDKTYTSVKSPATSTTDVTLGSRTVSDMELDGIMDELRIEDGVRSDEWIKFVYANSGGVGDNELTWGSQSVHVTPTSNPTTQPEISSVNSPVCTDLTPVSVPDLFQIDTTNDSATLYFTPIIEDNKYFISYSTSENAEEHGAEVILGTQGVQSYTVNLLNPNTTYYFKVRGQNGCQPGQWSNIKFSTTSSLVDTQTSQVTPVIQNIIEREIEVFEKNTTPKESNICEYEVKAGDNLWNIALENLDEGQSYTKIVELNDLENTTLSVGQVLKMPCSREDAELALEEKNQEGVSVEIAVKDDTGNPIEGIEVELHSDPKYSRTDENGIARFENVEQGEHKIYLTYEEYKGEEDLFVDGQDKQIDVELVVQLNSRFSSPAVAVVVATMGMIIVILLAIIFRKKTA